MLEMKSIANSFFRVVVSELFVTMSEKGYQFTVSSASSSDSVDTAQIRSLSGDGIFEGKGSDSTAAKV